MHLKSYNSFLDDESSRQSLLSDCESELDPIPVRYQHTSSKVSTTIQRCSSPPMTRSRARAQQQQQHQQQPVTTNTSSNARKKTPSESSCQTNTPNIHNSRNNQPQTIAESDNRLSLLTNSLSPVKDVDSLTDCLENCSLEEGTFGSCMWPSRQTSLNYPKSNLITFSSSTTAYPSTSWGQTNSNQIRFPIRSSPFFSTTAIRSPLPVIVNSSFNTTAVFEQPPLSPSANRWIELQRGFRDAASTLKKNIFSEQSPIVQPHANPFENITQQKSDRTSSWIHEQQQQSSLFSPNQRHPVFHVEHSAKSHSQSSSPPPLLKRSSASSHHQKHQIKRKAKTSAQSKQQHELQKTSTPSKLKSFIYVLSVFLFGLILGCSLSQKTATYLYLALEYCLTLAFELITIFLGSLRAIFHFIYKFLLVEK